MFSTGQLSTARPSASWRIPIRISLSRGWMSATSLTRSYSYSSTSTGSCSAMLWTRDGVIINSRSISSASSSWVQRGT